MTEVSKQASKLQTEQKAVPNYEAEYSTNIE